MARAFSVGSNHKAARGRFLNQNPFPGPLTDGLFYREKMRAIHRIAPDLPFRRILEVGGGRSGLTALLYPNAEVVNLDFDPSHATAPCNRQDRVRFVCADATKLPFAPATFDAVTMFDLLEHVPAHEQVAAEAWRVLRPDGYILVSTPNDHWRFPYYRFMRPFCPTDIAMMAEWGHVRRGYALHELAQLFGRSPEATSTFINAMTALCHDVSFSKLKRGPRKLVHLAISPLTALGYGLHRSTTKGTETTAAWRKLV
jgi:SAM-dependent methyltransferase